MIKWIFDREMTTFLAAYTVVNATTWNLLYIVIETWG